MKRTELFHKNCFAKADKKRGRSGSIVAIISVILLFHSFPLLAQPQVELSEEGFESLIKRNPSVSEVEFGKFLLMRTNLKIYVDATKWKNQDPLQRDVDFSTWFRIWKDSGGVQVRIIDFKTKETLKWKQFK